MSDEELSEEVKELRRRVSHLETELDTSYERMCFEENIRLLLGEDAEFTDEDPWQWKAENTIEPHEMNTVIDKLDNDSDLDWFIVSDESGEPKMRITKELEK